MSTMQFINIQDPIARAEAMRAQAVAEMIVGATDGLRDLVKSLAAKVSAYRQYRRTYDVLWSMTDRELDDIGISRADIPLVARGLDPRPRRVPAGDALAQRLKLAEAFGSAQPAQAPANEDQQRPAAAA